MAGEYARWRAANAERIEAEMQKRRRGIDVVRRAKAGEDLDALAKEYGVHKETILRLMHAAELIARRFATMPTPPEEPPGE